MNPVRVLLVNERRLMGNVIAAVLNDEPDIQVIDSVTDIKDTMEKAPHTDVALISTRLPDQNALRLTEALTENHPDVKVLVLGLAESEAEILQYVEAGACGYVLRDDSVEELLRHIRAAHNDEALVSPEIAGALIARVNELAQLFDNTVAVPSSNNLTPRERDVLQLLDRDLSNQEIADELFIEVGTVKNHVHSILQKLNVNSRQDAAAYWAILRDNSSD
jgi:DNA-binding NarL/FixJ family response regulator